MRLFPLALLLTVTPALAAHQDWQVRHQPDRFMDRVMMEAWADADSGPDRLSLYCDTENGFRVMFAPHSALLPEGPAHISIAVDGAAPFTLNGDAFGDDDTDIVTVYGTARMEAALATARHVVVHFTGAAANADQSFTFGDMGPGASTVMKVCPRG